MNVFEERISVTKNYKNMYVHEPSVQAKGV